MSVPAAMASMARRARPVAARDTVVTRHGAEVRALPERSVLNRLAMLAAALVMACSLAGTAGARSTGGGGNGSAPEPQIPIVSIEPIPSIRHGAKNFAFDVRRNGGNTTILVYYQVARSDGVVLTIRFVGIGPRSTSGAAIVPLAALAEARAGDDLVVSLLPPRSDSVYELDPARTEQTVTLPFTPPVGVTATDAELVPFGESGKQFTFKVHLTGPAPRNVSIPYELVASPSLSIVAQGEVAFPNGGTETSITFTSESGNFEQFDNVRLPDRDTLLRLRFKPVEGFEVSDTATVTLPAPPPEPTPAPAPTPEPAAATLELVQQSTGGTGTFQFSSNAFADVALTTRRVDTAVRSTPAIKIAAGSVRIQQQRPAGFALRRAGCTVRYQGGPPEQVGTIVSLAAATLDLTVEAGRHYVCTFQNGSHKPETERLVRNFLARRAAQLTEDTGRVRLLERRQAQTSGSASGTDSDGAISARGSIGQRKGLDAWASGTLRYHGYGDKSSGAGRFAMVRAGVDYATDKALVGVMAQYDYLSAETGAARVSGHGWMVGPYAEYAVSRHVVIDAKALWGRANNDVSPDGVLSDSFSSSRYLLSGRVTGHWEVPAESRGQWLLQPSAEVVWFRETSEAFTNGEGAPIDGQDASIGRVNIGPELAYRHVTESGAVIEPRAALRGLWQFSGDEGAQDDLQLRLEAGLKVDLPSGMSVSLDGSLTGLTGGDALNSAGGKVRIIVPFATQ